MSGISSIKSGSAAKKLSFCKLAALALFYAAATIAASAQSFTTLASFDFPTDGDMPAGPLVQGLDGNLYGTMESAGPSNAGTVFKLTPSGTLTPVHSFDGDDGYGPSSGLLLGADGNFYGTTATAGPYSGGTVFKITPAGALTTLYAFNAFIPAGGILPKGGLVRTADGSLYGGTYGGGTNSSGICPSGCGTIFKLSPDGTLTTLYNFCAQLNCPDGVEPASLVLGSDGNFYGTTVEGGVVTDQFALGCGTVFKITPAGALTTLYTFCSLPGAADGAVPGGPLTQALDGNFYGVTSGGGTGSNGTIFKISPSGILTTLYSFCAGPFCPQGSYPLGGLTLATDGNFYGITEYGGGDNCNAGCGALFQVTPQGVLTVLHQFGGRNGGNWPTVGLVQATNGEFYGTTSSGGTEGVGTAFSLSLGLTPFITLQPTSGQVGSQVTILGTNLSGATSVSFNGTPATILTNTGSTITTTVPAGATTGNVQVTVPGSTLVSNTDFQVLGGIQFVPVTPCRVVDTRNGNPITGGTSQSFTVPQLGNCGIPASAAAYSLNVTVSPHGPLGYLTIWPSGQNQPYVSTMNSPDGRIKANAAIVPAGNQGAVSVYATDTTDVVLDIDGYFATPGSQTYQFYPLPPCRIVDTRNNQDGGTVQAGMERDYNIAGQCGVPNTATAYSLNVTVLPAAGGLDYLTVWPKGETKPYVSTLNDPTGTIVANAAIVPAGSENATAFYPNSNNTDLLVDVDGYFAAPGADGLSLYAVAPCRVLDTRNSGNGFLGTMTVNVEGSPCAPPASAKAYVLNATVVPPGPMLYLTLWPHGESQPTVSTLNAQDGFITSNMAIVPTNDASIDAYAYALTQLILDISGYFAP